jgi:ClpP class serine protease
MKDRSNLKNIKNPEVRNYLERAFDFMNKLDSINESWSDEQRETLINETKEFKRDFTEFVYRRLFAKNNPRESFQYKKVNAQREAAAQRLKDLSGGLYGLNSE